jgi:hypothetical protein
VWYDAEEMRRRVEHRVGTLIIEGQEAGKYASPQHMNGQSLIEVLGVRSHNEVTTLRSYGRIGFPDFEAALELGRAEGSLSLAHVKRLASGEELQTSRSEWNYGRRRVDSNRIIRALANELEAACSGLELVNRSDLDPEERDECVKSIRASIRRIGNEMRKW